MLPTFLVIGAAKAGTTSLYEYLRAHPQIYMPQRKEPDFFSIPERWHRGLDWYESLFRKAERATAIGEASTSYTKHPHIPAVPERVASVIPDVCLIYMLREPIARMRSQYLFRVVNEWEKRPIEEALLEDSLYLDCSRYAHQLEQYLAFFDRDRILIITSEGLQQNRLETISSVYRFLGVDPGLEPTVLESEFNRAVDKRVSRGRLLNRDRLRRIPGYKDVAPYIPDALKSLVTKPVSRSVDVGKSRIEESLRKELESRLRDDVSQLRLYMGSDFDGWGFA
jgi:hypothetical protein